MREYLNATIFHGFCRFSGATHHGDWDALDQPNCTLLEVLMIDLDDTAAYANAMEFISQSIHGPNEEDSAIVTIAVVCHPPTDDLKLSIQRKDDLDQLSRCVPTLYANSQAVFDEMRLRLAMLSDALQGKTLRGLPHATLKAMVGTNGMVHAFVGCGVGADRIGSALRMTVLEAVSQGYDVSQARSALAVLAGQIGDLRVNESKVLAEMMLQHFGTDCWCEVATASGALEEGQIAVTLFLRRPRPS